MKEMSIYEPAMCCSTGLCGVWVDPELLRISTVLDALKESGIEVQRFNLSNSPQEFENNKAVSEFLNNKGVEKLPVTLIDGEIVIIGRYPSNEEFIKLLNIPRSSLGERPKNIDAAGCGGSCRSCC